MCNAFNHAPDCDCGWGPRRVFGDLYGFYGNIARDFLSDLLPKPPGSKKDQQDLLQQGYKVFDAIMGNGKAGMTKDDMVKAFEGAISQVFPVPSNLYDQKDFWKALGSSSPKRGDQFEMRLKHPITGAKSFHNGIDQPTCGEEGITAMAPVTGKVVFARYWSSYGNVVELVFRDSTGTARRLFYSHLAKINVKEGDTLSTGDVVGEVGSTGKYSDGTASSTGTHLHLGLGPQALMNHERIESTTLSEVPDGLAGCLKSETYAKRIVLDDDMIWLKGPMTEEDKTKLISLSPNPHYRKKIEDLFDKSKLSPYTYDELRDLPPDKLGPNAKVDNKLRNKSWLDPLNTSGTKDIPDEIPGYSQAIIDDIKRQVVVRKVARKAAEMMFRKATEKKQPADSVSKPGKKK